MPRAAARRNETSMRRAIAALLALVPVLLLTTGPALAAPLDEPILHDHYAADASVVIAREVLGDLGVAGGEVTVSGRVAADVFAAGGWVALQGPIGDDLRAAGGRVVLRGRVGDHAAMAGGSVEVGPGAEIGGQAWLAGGTVTVEGRIRGAAELAGEEVVLAGRIDGPVRVTARELRIEPTAHIAGDLVYRAPDTAAVAPGARVDGELVFHRTPEAGPSPVGNDDDGLSLVGLLLFVLAFLIVGLVLRLASPGLLERSHATLRREPLLAVGIGALLLLVGPLAAIGLFLLVITIPLALAGLLVLPALALVGYVVTASTLADLGRARITPGAPTGTLRYGIALALALLALGLLQAIPILGFLIAVGSTLAGTGAIAVAIRRWTQASAA